MTKPLSKEYQRKLERIRLLEEKQLLMSELPHLYKFKNYKWGREFIESTNRMNLLVAANQVSKAEPLDREILTTEGFKTFKELNVGDYVYGRNGEPTRIVDFPWQGTDLFYRVTFDDGDSMVVSKDHDWICMSPEERFRKHNKDYLQWQVKSTQDIYDHTYSHGSPRAPRRYVIPMASFVKTDATELPIHPYMLGLVIGDGCLAPAGKTITINDLDQKIIKYVVDSGATVRSRDHRNSQTLGIGFLAKKINELELNVTSAFKKIPHQYMTSGTSQRFDLLAGLMDTDGTVQADGKGCYYSTASKELAHQVKELANSLGAMAEIKVYKAGYKSASGEFIECLDNYCVNIFSEFNPFKLSDRKRDRWQLLDRYKHQRVIYSIEPVGQVSGRCISVDNADGSYLSGRDYIVTHNSSSLIKKNIILATDKSKWKEAFPMREPKVFWYIYPDTNKVEEELLAKWIGEFLPQGSMKDDPRYGWEILKLKNNNKAIKFNSGVMLYFKTWKSDLQSATVDMVSVDEELPSDLYPELRMRLARYNGIFNMVFTATLNQPYWYQAIERMGHKDELFPEAAKWQISLDHHCRFYEDGSPSPWTNDRITFVINSCGTQTEVDRRVHGRFVNEKGVKYASFERQRNVKEPIEIPKDWLWYSGVDIGSGGQNHPSAISIVAVRPDMAYGRLVKFWKGSPGVSTTSYDVLKQYIEMTKGMVLVGEYYDFSAADFGLIQASHGFNFQKANKNRGEDILNVLFKNEMLDLEKQESLNDLVIELMTLNEGTKKQNAKDDGIDSLRYATSSIPWDLSKIKSDQLIAFEKTLTKKPKLFETIENRDYQYVMPREDSWSVDAEIDEYNDLLGDFE